MQNRIHIFCALLLLVAEFAASVSAASVSELVDEGVSLTFEGRRDDADRVWETLRTEHPNDPSGWVHQVDTLYWRQMFDEGDTSYDQAIEFNSQEGARIAEVRIAAEESDARAHYHLGRALIHLGRLEGIRGRYLSAGTYGERGRLHLERAMELDPTLVDARYPLGLYYFYADLVTRWFKWLTWLWFVPSGDGSTGLRYIEETTEHGGVHQNDAQFVLADISMEFEPLRVEKATELIDDLHGRFPKNALIHYQLIDARFTSGRFEDVIDESHRLEDGSGGDGLDTLIRSMAPLWRARAGLQIGDVDGARRALEAFPLDGPPRPHWGSAWVGLTRAQLLDVVGRREDAEAFYERVVALEVPKRSRKAAGLAEIGLATPFAPVVAEGHVFRARPGLLESRP
ncbi:MAG: hypothetical protein P8R42_06150 [Candidatus Binatia bacterium]|nr:hypothetical protein [Candidatus Binatia bacterium]